MHPLDATIVGLFIAACAGLGIWSGRGTRGLSGYLLGERDLPAWAVTLSIVATETSAVTFLSIPGLAYRHDLTFLQLACGYVIARLLIACWLLPAYFQGQIETAYQVLARRFGGTTQQISAVLFLISRTLGSGLRLYLAARVLEQITGWPLPLSIGTIGLATLIYTYLGGLKGVIWADVLQFAVYITAGVVAVVMIGRLMPGGWQAIVELGALAGKWRVLNTSFQLSDPYTLWAGLIGATVLDLGSHGVDHMMVQRYLAARSQRQASVALIASGFVILAQFALFLGIGVGLWALDQSRGGTASPARDAEFATFIVRELPIGMRGLVIAAVFSVTMSTVSGAISASTSSFISDLVRPLRPHASESALLHLSRVMTAVWGLAQIAVACGAISMNQAVIDAALAIAGFVFGILLGVFALGMFRPQIDQTAALAGMLTGLTTVSIAAFGTRLAYPWYALVGASAVLLAAEIAQRFIDHMSQRRHSDQNTVPGNSP